MTHSHLPARHLIKQVQIQGRSKRSRKPPEWIRGFVERVADLFEPLTDDGRVGYECEFAQKCWAIGVYLGSTETVGGPNDGSASYAEFQFDLLPLLELFAEIGRFRWGSFPGEAGSDDEVRHMSVVTVEGRVQQHAVRLQIYSVPPPCAPPGFRQYADGRREAVG